MNWKTLNDADTDVTLEVLAWKSQPAVYLSTCCSRFFVLKLGSGCNAVNTVLSGLSYPGQVHVNFDDEEPWSGFGSSPGCHTSQNIGL